MVITTAYYKARNVKVNKAKSPYFTSVARNGHLTNNTEADGALILPPLSISAPFNGYLKLLKGTRKGKKSKEGFEVTLRNRTPRDPPHRRPHTNQLR